MKKKLTTLKATYCATLKRKLLKIEKEKSDSFTSLIHFLFVDLINIRMKTV